MGTANRDASETSRRRAQLALYGFRREVNYPQNALPGRPEQPRTSGFEGPSSTVPVWAYLGAQLVGRQGVAASGGDCGCPASLQTQLYDKRAPGQ